MQTSVTQTAAPVVPLVVGTSPVVFAVVSAAVVDETSAVGLAVEPPVEPPVEPAVSSLSLPPQAVISRARAPKEASRVVRITRSLSPGFATAWTPTSALVRPPGTDGSMARLYQDLWGSRRRIDDVRESERVGDRAPIRRRVTVCGTP